MELETVRTRDWGTVDLVESPDDGGWYAQRWSDDAITTIYPSRDELFVALGDPELRWEAEP